MKRDTRYRDEEEMPVSNRSIVIISAVCVLVLAVLAVLAVKWMSNRSDIATRSQVRKDAIYINVLCDSGKVLTDEDIASVSSGKSLGNHKFTDNEVKLIENCVDELCMVELRYEIDNKTGKTISDFDMNLSGSSILYYCSPLTYEDAENPEEYVAHQTIIFPKSYVDDKYIQSDYKGQFNKQFTYEFLYNMEGADARKSLVFETAVAE